MQIKMFKLNHASTSKHAISKDAIKTCKSNHSSKSKHAIKSCKQIQTCNQNMQVESCKQIQTCNQNMQIKTFKLNHASTSKHAMIAYFFLACFSSHHICALCMLLAQVFNFDSTLLDLPAFPLHTLPWCEPTLKHGSTTCLELLSLKFCQLVVCFAWNLGIKQLKDCSWQVVLCKCILCKSLRSSTKGHGRLRRGRGSGRLKTVESIGTQSALGKC